MDESQKCSVKIYSNSKSVLKISRTRIWILLWLVIFDRLTVTFGFMATFDYTVIIGSSTFLGGKFPVETGRENKRNRIVKSGRSFKSTRIV